MEYSKYKFRDKSIKERLKKVNQIYFDMDGVITSEKNYWLSAALTVMELIYSRSYMGLNDLFLDKPELTSESEYFVSSSLIINLKNRAVNTNWDLAYFAAGLYILELLKEIDISDIEDKIEEEGFTSDILQKIGEKKDGPLKKNIDELSSAFFAKYDSVEGFGYTECLNSELKEITGIRKNIFTRDDNLWKLCMEIFQEWFLGTELYEKKYKKKLTDRRKKGMLETEVPVISLEKIRETLIFLKSKGCSLGFATGRPYEEVIIPLEKWNLLDYFDIDHRATHRQVEIAENELRLKEETVSLSKPHPFLFLAAIYADSNYSEILNKKMPEELRKSILIVGDSASDILIAKELSCLSAAVLTGILSKEAEEGLLITGPDIVIENVSDLKSLF